MEETTEEVGTYVISAFDGNEWHLLKGLTLVQYEAQLQYCVNNGFPFLTPSYDILED